MDSTTVVTEPQIEALAEKLAAFEDLLDENDKVALLAVFELAGEALTARIDDRSEVQGFVQGNFNVGIQVGVPATLPGLDDGLLGSVAQKGKGGGKGRRNTMMYFKVVLKEVMISSVS